MPCYWIGGTLLVLIIAFLWWRLTSVGRGARTRDGRLLVELDPIGVKLADGEEVSAEEINAIADRAQFRPMLYEILKHFERLDLFPERYLNAESQAEAQLCYWMMHPNELQDAPAEIKLIETIDRNLNGRDGKFFVFRYQMPEGHWAKDDGWLVGLAGPYYPNGIPYAHMNAFSRCSDRHGQVEPTELVDSYVNMIEAKFPNPE